MAFYLNGCCWINENWVVDTANCPEKATDIEEMWLVCPDDMTIAIETGAETLCEKGYISGWVFASDPAAPPPDGLAAYTFANDDGQDLSEVLTFDDTSALKELNETLVWTLCADTPDKLCQLRSMIGKEVAAVIKLKAKTGDFQYMMVNPLGGMKITSIDGSIKKGYYDVTLAGEPNCLSLFIDAGGIAATETLIDNAIKL